MSYSGGDSKYSRNTDSASYSSSKPKPFSPTASYNPAVNESIRNISVDNSDDEDEAVALDDQRLGALNEEEEAMEDDPDFGKPFFQTRKGKLTVMVILIVLVVIGVVVAIVVTQTGNSNRSTDPTPIPTPSPIRGEFVDRVCWLSGLCCYSFFLT